MNYGRKIVVILEELEGKGKWGEYDQKTCFTAQNR